jgi:hypothetical protein
MQRALIVLVGESFRVGNQNSRTRGVQLIRRPSAETRTVSPAGDHGRS